MTPTVLNYGGQRYVLAGAVNWSAIAGEIAALGLVLRRVRGSKWGGMLTFLSPAADAEQGSAGYFVWSLADDKVTVPDARLYTLTSRLQDRFHGRYLGLLGYLLVLEQIVKYDGWAGPEAALAGGSTSPGAMRVWRSLTSSPDVAVKTVGIRSGITTPVTKVRVCSWTGRFNIAKTLGLPVSG